MKDLRFFETEADYKNTSIEYPNVSYTKDSEDVWIIDNPNKIIMTSESNPDVMEICYNQGWAANENYMTKAEAEAVTDIGTAFSVGGGYGYGYGYNSSLGKIKTFDEFKYFINVTSIDEYAFYNCRSLTSITIPNSVTSIGNYAFGTCESLSSITIPNSVTEIGGYTFDSCTLLSEITIGNGVITIGEYAFRLCESLSSITIPNSVTTIGNGVFNQCSSLSEITIGNGVITIGNSVFNWCSSLTSITIPNSVTTIGRSVFANSSLSEITCLAETAPAILSDTFESIKSNGVLYYPQGSDYSSWLSTSNYYLGKYNWSSQII